MDELTDAEFELLDELYFVQHYSAIKEELNWQDSQIATTLIQLIDKGFVKPLSDQDTEFMTTSKLVKDSSVWTELYFLATKKGLMAHNGF